MFLAIQITQGKAITVQPHMTVASLPFHAILWLSDKGNAIHWNGQIYIHNPEQPIPMTQCHSNEVKYDSAIPHSSCTKYTFEG